MPSDNLIRIMCPNLSCQRILAVPEQARGRIVRCRVCGMNIRIPQGKAAGSQPQKPAPGQCSPPHQVQHAETQVPPVVQALELPAQVKLPAQAVDRLVTAFGQQALGR